MGETEVRGRHVRVMAKGRDVHITRSVQKLYPIEVHAGLNAGKTSKTKIECNQQICKGAVRLAEWLLWMPLKR